MTEPRNNRYPVTCWDEEVKSAMSDPVRVAVVTGGAQGIGRRTAELLAEREFRLAIIDLQEPKATVEAIEQRGGLALGSILLTLPVKMWSRSSRKGVNRFGRVDVLVNNGSGDWGLIRAGLKRRQRTNIDV